MNKIIEVEIPSAGESITEVQIGQWFKQEGDWVDSGEDLVEIETEKASMVLPAPGAGVVDKITKQEEEFANVGEVIGSIRLEAKPAGNAAPSKGPSSDGSSKSESDDDAEPFVMPAAQRLLDENGLTAAQVPASGPGGRLLKEDVIAYLDKNKAKSTSAPPAVAPPPPMPPSSLIADETAHRSEEVKPLSMLRRTIALRLVEAQQNAALLTTFNEINMKPVMELRKKYKDAFLKKHGVKLGFMSFFSKAAVEALRTFPAVNAEIRENNVVYRNYHDIGVAIGGGKGLVVPVLRNVERMSFAQIEWSIGDFARKAGENRIQPEDLIGGTFTISNGGVYGSLLSTPIVNPPQSGILGLHAIQERPMAVNGEVVILPMMYVALTYDHRIVDGREAVGFLKTIKDVIEDPARMFLEV